MNAISGYFSCIFRKSGSSSLQNGHHAAQKLITAVLSPLCSSRVVCVPSKKVISVCVFLPKGEHAASSTHTTTLTRKYFTLFILEDILTFFQPFPSLPFTTQYYAWET